MTLEQLYNWAQAQIDNRAKAEVRGDIGVSVLQLVDELERLQDYINANVLLVAEDNLQVDSEFPQPLVGVRSHVTSSTIKTVDTGFQPMDFRYRWKNGAPPSRDAAAREKHLLDESQFQSDQDRQLAEEAARKHLNVPLRTPDDDTPVLPQ